MKIFFQYFLWPVKRIGIAIAAIIFFGNISSVSALGMSPAEFTFDTPLAADDVVTGTVRIVRNSGQTGALTIEVSPHGSCNTCITGSDYFVIPSDASGYNYTFSLSPGDLAGGDYTQFIAFYLYSEPEEGSGTASASIQQGVTIVIRFSVAENGASLSESISSTTSSGGGGGSASGGSGTTNVTPDSEEVSTAPLSDEVEPTHENDTENGSKEVSSKDAQEVPSDAEFISTAPSVDQEVAGETISENTIYTIQPDIYAEHSERIATIEDYFSKTCTMNCDVNEDAVVTFSDVVQYYVDLAEEQDPEGDTDGVIAIPPLEEEGIQIRIEHTETQKTEAWKFIPSVYAEDSLGDENIFDLVVDTGPTGIFGTELYINFDTTLLKFRGFETNGSVFPHVQVGLVDTERGILHIGAVTENVFIGTGGRILGLRFYPIHSGVANLTFQTANVYLQQSPSDIPLQLFGATTQILAQEVDSTIEYQAQGTDMERDQEKKGRWMLSGIFLFVSIGSIVALMLCLLELRKKKK